MIVEYYIDVNEKNKFYEINLKYSTNILYVSIVTKDINYKDKLYQWYNVQSLYYNETYFKMKNDDSEEEKNKIK